MEEVFIRDVSFPAKGNQALLSDTSSIGDMRAGKGDS